MNGMERTGSAVSARGEKAEKLFLSGYNCAQAVFGAFADVTGLPFDTAMRIASSLGGGVGRLREICGAVSAAEMVLGAVLGYDTPETGEVKAAHYARVQKLAYEFKERRGSYVCRELLGVQGAEGPAPEKRGPAFYASRPCAALVREAAELIARTLLEAGRTLNE